MLWDCQETKKSIVIKFILAPPAPSAQDRPDGATPINDDDMLPEWCHRSLMGSMQMMMMTDCDYGRISKPLAMEHIGSSERWQQLLHYRVDSRHSRLITHQYGIS